MNRSSWAQHGDILFLSEKERGKLRHTKREREGEREIKRAWPDMRSKEWGGLDGLT